LFTGTGPVFQVFRRDAAEQAKQPDGLTRRPDPLANLAEHEETAIQSAQFSVTFGGGNLVEPVGLDRAETVYNYYVGEESSWRTGVPTFQKVAYQGLYDGIDLYTWGRRDSLKYEFHVAPGADYRQIQVQYQGTEGLSLDPLGNLHVQTSLGELVDDAPYVYQEIGGLQIEVPARFELVDAQSCRFVLTGDYDPSVELVIDPDLAWTTYLGGTADDYSRGIAVDGDGNALVTGYTLSSDFAGANNSFQGGYSDAFVAKVTSGGVLAWATYLGGSGIDVGSGIAVDVDGHALVTGETVSSDFAGANNSIHPGDVDAFVANVTSGGSLAWATYLGGSGGEGGCGIAVDGYGNALVTGGTTSSDFAGANNTYNGYGDPFVAMVTTGGSLAWATYLGGSADDYGSRIAVDSAGNALVTGTTDSSDFAGADNSYHGGFRDAFAAKVTSGGLLAWATYLGGSNYDDGQGIAVDGAGNALVTGGTSSSDFAGANNPFRGVYGSDAFVAKVTSAGLLAWATFLGGSGDDAGHGIAMDGAGNALVTGDTFSSDFPGANNSFHGSRDAFVAKISGAGAAAPSWAMTQQFKQISPAAFDGAGDDVTLSLEGVLPNQAVDIWIGATQADMRHVGQFTNTAGADPWTVSFDLHPIGLLTAEYVAAVSSVPLRIATAQAIYTSTADLVGVQSTPSAPADDPGTTPDDYTNIAKLYRWDWDTNNYKPQTDADLTTRLAGRKSVFLTHGWNDDLDFADANREYMTVFAALFDTARPDQTAQFNVFAIDWFDADGDGKGSPFGSDPNGNPDDDGGNPRESLSDARKSADNGIRIGRAFASTLVAAGVNPQSLYLVGHSNGAGFMASLAEELKIETGSNVSRLVSLDAPTLTAAHSAVIEAADSVDRVENYYIPPTVGPVGAVGFGGPMFKPHTEIANFRLDAALTRSEVPEDSIAKWAHEKIPIRFARTADAIAGHSDPWGFQESQFATGSDAWETQYTAGSIWREASAPGRFSVGDNSLWHTGLTPDVMDFVASSSLGYVAEFASAVQSVGESAYDAVRGFGSEVISRVDSALRWLHFDAHSPVLASVDVSIPADADFVSFDLSVQDPGNADTLLVSIGSNVVGQIDLASQAGGGGSRLDFWVKDYAGQTATLNFYMPSDVPSTAEFLISDIEFVTLNKPPIPDQVPDQSVVLGSQLTFTVTANDPDGDQIAFSLDETAPAGAAIDPVTGVFTWTPSMPHRAGTYDVIIYTTDDGPGKATSIVPVHITVDSAIGGRHLFYNRSKFDGNNSAANAADDVAIDPAKEALLPGGGKAAFKNYTTFSRGLNGIMVDVAGLPSTTLDAARDFGYRYGNDDTPSAWATAANPTSITVRAGAGTGGSDRVTLIWPDNAIPNGNWLQVTVLANAHTGLAAADVFYFGGAIGDTGNSTADAKVNSQDVTRMRNNYTGFGTVDITSVYDVNRDRKVNSQDVTICRNHYSGFSPLRLFWPPFAPPSPASDPALLATGAAAPSANSAEASRALAGAVLGQDGIDWSLLQAYLDLTWTWESERGNPKQKSSHSEANSAALLAQVFAECGR